LYANEKFSPLDARGDGRRERAAVRKTAAANKGRQKIEHTPKLIEFLFHRHVSPTSRADFSHNRLPIECQKMRRKKNSRMDLMDFHYFH
jgi:hypothetical protein